MSVDPPDQRVRWNANTEIAEGWDNKRKKWIKLQWPIGRTRQAFRWLVGRLLGIIAVAIAFVVGAVAPVPTVLVNNAIVRPVATFLRGEPLLMTPNLAYGCDMPSVATGGIVALDPTVNYNLWVSQEGLSYPDASRGTAVYNQATLYITLRPRWKEPVVVERVHAELSPIEIEPEWLARPLSSGCGGNDGVGSRVYRLDSDIVPALRPDYPNSRGLDQWESGPRFLTLPDAPTDIEVDIRSCEKSVSVRILVDYSVQGVFYEDQVAAAVVIAAENPQTEISYDDTGVPIATNRWHHEEGRDVCAEEFERGTGE